MFLNCSVVFWKIERRSADYRAWQAMCGSTRTPPSPRARLGKGDTSLPRCIPLDQGASVPLGIQARAFPPLEPCPGADSGARGSRGIAPRNPTMGFAPWTPPRGLGPCGTLRGGCRPRSGVFAPRTTTRRRGCPLDPKAGPVRPRRQQGERIGAARQRLTGFARTKGEIP